MDVESHSLLHSTAYGAHLSLPNVLFHALHSSVLLLFTHQHSVYPYHTYLTYIQCIDDSIRLSSSLTFQNDITRTLSLQVIEVMTLRDSRYYNSLRSQSEFLFHLVVNAQRWTALQAEEEVGRV